MCCTVWIFLSVNNCALYLRRAPGNSVVYSCKMPLFKKVEVEVEVRVYKLSWLTRKIKIDVILN